MQRSKNEEYMAVLGALGAAIENGKSDLALAKYEIELLEQKLKLATDEIAELNALIPTVNGAGVVENLDYPYK